MQLQVDKLGKVAVTVEQGYWSNEKDYDRLTIVEAPKGEYKTYISRKPVPAGTVLTNREYWIPFSSLKEEIVIDFNEFVASLTEAMQQTKDYADNTIEQGIEDITAIKEEAMRIITYIADNGIDSTVLAPDSVTSEKIKAGNVLSRHIGEGEVKSANIGAGEVKSNNIGEGEVKSTNIGTGEVKSNNIGEGEVKEGHIAPGAITTEKLATPVIEELQTIMDATPTPDSEKPVNSGGVFNSVINSGVFDLSAHTGDSYADLSAALTAMNALPAAYKKGGMSIKYVQSSDNNSVYVQYRLMKDEFSATPADWQGVDDILIAGSKNLAKSGDVINKYGGNTNIEFNVTENTVLYKEISFVCKKGVTYKLKLNSNGLIDTNGVTAIIKNGSTEVARHSLTSAGWDYTASEDSNIVVLSRSAAGIIGTGTCSIDAGVPYIFYTKEESAQIEAEQTAQLRSEIESSASSLSNAINANIVSVSDDTSTGGKVIKKGTSVIASDVAVQHDVYKYGSTKSTERNLTIIDNTTRRFTLNFPLIEGRTYKLKFGNISGTWHYIIYNALDGTTTIIEGDASSSSEQEFTAEASYDNIQILFASGITAQTIKLILSDLTEELEHAATFATKTEVSAIDEKCDDLTLEINGGVKDLTNDRTKHNPNGYYTGSIGNTIGFSSTENSLAYNAIDLSSYIGTNVVVTVANATTGSSRITALCDSNGVIGDYVTEDSFSSSVDNKRTFKPNSTYKYLYISHKSTASSQVKVEVESLESKVDDKIKPLVPKNFVYVSPNGSDSNLGTSASPFATIAKALSVSNKIILLDGVYSKETIVPSSYDYDEIIIKGAETKRAIINFGDNYLVNNGSETLVSGYTKVYQVACATMPFASGCTNAYMWQDYVDDPNTPIANLDRHPLHRGREYRCDSTMIKQVASVAAIEALGENEFGWYWENGVMYFSRPEVSSASHPIVIPRRDDWFINMMPNWTTRKQIKVVMNNVEVRYAGINLGYTANCELSDVLVKYNYVTNGGCFYIYACQNCSLIRCEAAGVTNGTTTGDGFNVDTAGTADDPKALCLSLYMRDCWAHDVNDDGYSDHDNSEVTIEGGLFEYCGKGGLTPAFGSNDIIMNAICRYNRGAGILATGNPDVSRKFTNITAMGCVCNGQTYGFQIAAAQCKIKCISCITFDNNYGYYADVGSIYAINCKSSDTNAKHGGVTIKNATDLS